jgi:hypothetical protein
MNLPPVAPVVRTVYRGPTDTRGSRVIATNVTSGKRKVVPWDHSLDAPENHYQAACAVLHAGWAVASMCSEKGGGFLFATTPKEPT